MIWVKGNFENKHMFCTSTLDKNKLLQHMPFSCIKWIKNHYFVLLYCNIVMFNIIFVMFLNQTILYRHEPRIWRLQPATADAAATTTAAHAVTADSHVPAAGWP